MPANEVLYAKEIAESLTYLNEYADLVTEHRREEIDQELSESDELYDAVAKEKEIKEKLSNKLSGDEGMKMIVDKLPKLISEARVIRRGSQEKVRRLVPIR